MDDYSIFLEEIGVTPEEMEAAKNSMPPPLAPLGTERYYTAESNIEGIGCFAKQDIVAGPVGIFKYGSTCTALGRYTNHSPTPNAYVLMQAGLPVMYATALQGEELTLDYRDVMRVMR